jgi:pSer/pThr/pTyr-binding forkhead associated (FHA) protein
MMWVLQSSPADSANDPSAPEAVPLTFRVSPGSTKTIGRATGADFVIDTALVSRVHCRLEAGSDAIEVVDLSSTNGTYVNNARVDRARLNDGDRLRVGRVEFTVRSV